MRGVEESQGSDWAADTSMQRATRTLPARYKKSPADADLRQAEKNAGWRKGEARKYLRASVGTAASDEARR